MRRLIILHVEDNKQDTLLLARACKAAKLSADFHDVSGGAEAMAYLNGEGEFADRSRYAFPDIVILDLKMSDMSGFDLLKWLREKPEFRSLPVLVFTESRIMEDRARAIAAGAAGYFVKPVDFESLVHLAESLVQFSKI